MVVGKNEITEWQYWIKGFAGLIHFFVFLMVEWGWRKFIFLISNWIEYKSNKMIANQVSGKLTNAWLTLKPRIKLNDTNLDLCEI